MKKSELKKLVLEVINEESVSDSAEKFLKTFLQAKNLKSVTLRKNGNENIISFKCDSFDFERKDLSESKITSIYFDDGEFEITTKYKIV